MGFKLQTGGTKDAIIIELSLKTPSRTPNLIESFNVQLYMKLKETNGQ